MAHKFPIEKLMLDATTTLLVLFCALFAIEAIQEKAQKAQNVMAINGPEKRILVELEWDPTKNVDIDLWVKAPLDDQPVGYSRTNDRQSSYQRDDKGTNGDLSSFNYEVSSIRALAPGIYVINVHWFSNFDNVSQMPVKIRASLSAAGGAGYQIAISELTLEFKGQEKTAFSFEIDGNGAVIEGSLSHNYIPLRITHD